jgi:hypothetical protein
LLTSGVPLQVGLASARPAELSAEAYTALIPASSRPPVVLGFAFAVAAPFSATAMANIPKPAKPAVELELVSTGDADAGPYPLSASAYRGATPMPVRRFVADRAGLQFAAPAPCAIANRYRADTWFPVIVVDLRVGETVAPPVRAEVASVVMAFRFIPYPAAERDPPIHTGEQAVAPRGLVAFPTIPVKAEARITLPEKPVRMRAEPVDVACADRYTACMSVTWLAMVFELTLPLTV